MGEGKTLVLGELRLPKNLISGVRCCSVAAAWRRIRVGNMLEILRFEREIDDKLFKEAEPDGEGGGAERGWLRAA